MKIADTRNDATAAELARLDSLVISTPAEQYDVTPGRGMYLLERVDADRTAGGLHIPDKARESQVARWRVLAVGSDGITSAGVQIPPLYAVGDELWLNPQLGALMEIPAAKGQVIATESCVIARVRVRPQ